MTTSKTTRGPTPTGLGTPGVPSYTASQFVKDGRRLLAQADPEGRPPKLVEALDGRRVSLRAKPLLDAVRVQDSSLCLFCDSYGEVDGPDRLCRFCAALEYLHGHWPQLCRAGLASDHPPYEVYEEFVEFLLAFEPGAGRQTIPDRALTRFLDEWGHRWT